MQQESTISGEAIPKLDPQTGRKLEDQARQLKSRAEYQELVASLQAYQQDEGVYTLQGLGQLALQDYSEALNNFNRAIELKPDYRVAYLNRGKIYRHQGKLVEALADWNKAIELEPNDLAAYVNRSTVYFQQGKLSEALVDCNRAIELEPNNPAAYSNRSLVFKGLGKYQQALDDLNRLVQLVPGVPLLEQQRDELHRLVAREQPDSDRGFRLQSLSVKNFTVFAAADFPICEGINILIGENGTGKSQLLRLAYSILAAVCHNTTNGSYSDILQGLFRHPLADLIRTGEQEAELAVSSSHGKSLGQAVIRFSQRGDVERSLQSIKPPDGNAFQPVFLSSHELLSMYPGFLSLLSQRYVEFDDTYRDTCLALGLPLLKGEQRLWADSPLQTLEQAMGGKVILENDRFYLEDAQLGKIEINMVAEGHRKFAMLARLVANGSIRAGSALFWDEPETNLNPCIIRILVQVLVQLQRMGVQIILATHSYEILKEFDLQTQGQDKIVYHSLYRDPSSRSSVLSSTKEYNDISPNAIDDTFGSFIDREIQRSMKD